MKNKKPIFITLALLTIAAIAFFGCRARQTKAEPNAEAQIGQIVTAFIGDLARSASASGKVLPRQEVTLSLELPGTVTAVPIHVGDRVQTGDALVQLDAAELALAVAAAEQTLIIQQANLAQLQAAAAPEEIAAAQAAAASAQAQLDDLLDGPRPEEIAAANANLRAAEAAVAAANASLSQTAAIAADAEIAAAQAALAAAQAQETSARIAVDRTVQDGRDASQLEQNLAVAREQTASAQARLDGVLAGADANAVNAAQANLSAAIAQRDNSQAQLDALTADPTAAQIASLEQQIAQSQAALDALFAGASAAQIAAAEAQVVQAELALADAQDAFAKATLTAPFAGVVTAVTVNVGEFASGPAVELMVPDSLELALAVDEVDVGLMVVGQPAVVTLETWPDVTISSQISSIAPSAAPTLDGLVSYEVRLVLEQTDLLARSGMTANADLITAERNGALLVPSRAILVDRASGVYSVNLVVGETVTTIPVTIGLRDGRYTEITGGLNEGDQILVGSILPTLDYTIGDGTLLRQRNSGSQPLLNN